MKRWVDRAQGNFRSEAPSNEAESVSRSSGRRLLFHHLFHPFLHFFRRGFRFVGSDHPAVAIGIDNRAASIAPKHVHYWTLRSSAKFRRFLNYSVDILDV